MSIIKENGTIWIDKIPVLIWGMQKDTATIGAIESALSVTEHPFSYQDLMMFSASGLTTKWFQGSGEFFYEKKLSLYNLNQAIHLFL